MKEKITSERKSHFYLRACVINSWFMILEEHLPVLKVLIEWPSLWEPFSVISVKKRNIPRGHFSIERHPWGSLRWLNNLVYAGPDSWACTIAPGLNSEESLMLCSCFLEIFHKFVFVVWEWSQWDSGTSASCLEPGIGVVVKSSVTSLLPQHGVLNHKLSVPWSMGWLSLLISSCTPGLLQLSTWRPAPSFRGET